MGGFVDRLQAVGLGFAGALKNAGGLVVDLATAPWNDDESFQGFFNTLIDRTAIRGSEVIGQLFGPNRGFGAAIGGLPEQVRSPVRTAARQVETASRTLIHEPLSTMLLAGSLADSRTWGAQGNTTGIMGLADPDTWRKAHDLAQTTSPGQSLGLLMGTKDLLDQSEVNRIVGQDWFNVMSGTTDALVRLFLDVDILAGKAFTAAKVAKLDRVMSTADRLRRHVDSPQFARFADDVARIVDESAGQAAELKTRATAARAEFRTRVAEARPAAQEARAAAGRVGAATGDEVAVLERASTEAAERARTVIDRSRAARARTREAERAAAAATPQAIAAERIRASYFRNVADGGRVAWWVAHADGADEIADVIRVAALGDLTALERVSPALRSRMQQTIYETGIVKRHDGPFDEHHARVGALNDDLDGLDAEADDVLRSLGVVEEGERRGGLVADQPLSGKRAPGAGTIEVLSGSRASTAALRDGLRQGRILQTGPLGQAVRFFDRNVFRMLPHRSVALHEEHTTGVQLGRSLRQAGLGEDEIASWTGRITAPGLSATDRFELWQQADNAAFRKIGAEYGLSRRQTDQILARAARGRRQAQTILSRRYSAAVGEGGRRVDVVAFKDDEGLTLLPAPLTETQAPNFAHPPDYKAIRTTLDRWQERGWLDKAKDSTGLATELAESVSYWWKAGVLLRPGWTARVVLMDEQLRGLVKFGMFDWMMGGGSVGDVMRFRAGAPLGVRKLAVGLSDEMGITSRRVEKTIDEAGEVVDETTVVERGPRAGLAVAGAGGLGLLAGGPVGGAIGAGLGLGVVRALRSVDDAGYLGVGIDGLKVQGAFGPPGDTADIFEKMVSSSPQRSEILNAEELGVLSRLRGDPNRWRTVTGTDAGYGEAWQRAINDQIGQSQIGRRIIEAHVKGLDAGSAPARAQVIDEVAGWLDAAEDGQRVWRQIPVRRHIEGIEAKRDTAAAAYDTIMSYTGGFGDVMRKALTRKADVEDLRRHVRSADDLPDVHGESLDQMLGASELVTRLDGMVEKAYKLMGQIPTDTLSRQRAFDGFYRSEMAAKIRAFRSANTRNPTPREISQMETASRRQALLDARQLMYELAERNEFGHLSRFMMPFFSAWQEVISRWAGLAVENPAAIARILEVFHAPNRAGLIYTDPESGDEFLTFRLPEFAASMVNAVPWLSGALDSQGFVRLPKDGFSMMAQGMPGFGPFVQMPIASVVRERPDLESTLKFMFPYGAPDDVVDAMSPAWGRRLRSLTGKEDNRSYAAALARTLTTKLTRMQNGEIDPIDVSDPAQRTALIAEAKAETDAFFRLRMVANMFSPVSPMFDSPYREYIRTYRELQRADPSTADEKFLSQFGPEFFALTQSLTDLNNGVPSTLHGFESEQRFEELIQRWPEYGGIIVGADGGGEAVKFSSAMYTRQLNTPVRPGSGEMQRERLAPEEIVTSPQVRLGWTEFSRAMDVIDAEMVARGLPNLQVAAAEPLAQLKRAKVMQLAETYPEWFAEYATTDRNKWDRRLEAFADIAADPRLSGRPDIAGIGEYLRGRRVMVEALSQRRFTTLSAVANQDLAMLWDTFVAELRERNPAFADLHARWLTNDPLAGHDLERAA